MKNLFILELLLISHKEKKARRIQFDRRRTLIHGKNHTGKSSLIKSIYHTFGAEPLINPKFQNANTTALVKFEINGLEYEILRTGKLFAIFNGYGELISKFDSVTKGLGLFFSNLFDFNPLYQSKSGDFIIPPPAFLLLPYYVDQDESWSKSWASFKKLDQIKDSRNQSIYYHSGIRPNDYYQTKKEIEQFIIIIEETEKERKITSKILSDIKEKLSQTDFNIDIDVFKEEITELLTQTELLKQKEEKLKSDLLDLYNLKSVIDSQINIVKHAILENNQDLKYVSDKLPLIVGCPTCGAEYENSFQERFEIAHDEMKSKDLLIELNSESHDISVKILSENESLSKITSEVQKIEKLLEEKKGDIQLSDVISNSGKNQVRQIFFERTKQLQATLVENALEKEKLEKKLKAYENKERKENITNYYHSKMAEFLRKLDVNTLNFEDYSRITAKIENIETGSSRPRALIAYYFAFFHLMQKYSSSAYCPLIIDSPNQQDQDVEHIDKIMEFINSNQPENSQMILGLAENYGVDFDCKTIELTEKYSLLQKDEYDSVHDIIEDRLAQLWFK